MPATTANDADILGMLLIDPSLIPYAEARISQEDFGNHWYQETFDALATLSCTGQPIDLYAVWQQMHAPGWFMARLGEMVERAPDPLHGHRIIDRWLDVVRERGAIDGV